MDSSDDESNLNKNNDNIEIVEIDTNIPTEGLISDFLDAGMDDDDDDDDDESTAMESEIINDNSAYTIEKHTGGVFCIDVSKNYLASGGEDDKAYIWEYDDKTQQFNLIFESEKCKDSIVSLKFSNDSKYLSYSDMAGNISVIDIEKKTVFWSYELGSDVELLDWHPGCNVLFIGTCDGYLYMFKLSTNEIKMMYNGDSQSKLNCFRILLDGKRAACAYSNGQLSIWELKTQQVIFNIKSSKDAGEILCMDMSSDGNLIAYGGNDLKLNIINTNTGKLLQILDCNINEKSDNKDDEGENEVINSIESVGFCKVLPLLACVTVHGEIFIWDLQNYSLRHKSINEYKFGFSKLLWNLDYRLFISSLNGKIYEFDGRNLELKFKYEGHEAEILDFCLSKDYKYLFTASDDHKIKIYELNQ